jgi:membrane-associated protein
MQFFLEIYHLLWNLGDEKQWTHFIEFVGGANTVYLVMFAIIFCETGLVIFPFLPGDSLLFAIGAMGSQLEIFDYRIAAGLLIVAALLGDNVNYWIGRRFGPMLFSKDADAIAHGTKPGLFLRLLNKKHLHRTEQFFERHGAKAVMLARFVVIIRTFTPFVAGMGKMNYGRFLLFSVIGAVTWVVVCVGAGVLLGRLQFVKDHFELIIIAILFAAFVPVIFKLLFALIAGRRAASYAVDRAAS